MENYFIESKNMLVVDSSDMLSDSAKEKLGKKYEKEFNCRVVFVYGTFEFIPDKAEYIESAMYSDGEAVRFEKEKKDEI